MLLNHVRDPHALCNAVVRAWSGAAGVTANAAEVVRERLPVRVHLAAFPVTTIDALADHLRLADSLVARLVAGAILAHWNADADLADLVLPFRDCPVAANGAFLDFLHRFALVSGILLDPLLGLVSNLLALIGFGDALSHADSPRARATTAICGSGLCIGAGGGSSGHRCDDAKQQSDTDGLPYHAISFVAVHADPPDYGYQPLGGSQTVGEIPHP